MLQCSDFSPHEKESKPNLDVNSGFFVLGLNSGPQSLVGFLYLCSGFQLTQDLGFREQKFLELGNPDSLQWQYILMNFLRTLADDHGVAQSCSWGGRAPWRPRHFIQLYYEEKHYFLLLKMRGYFCTHFHVKRKRHRHFLGFSFAAKLDFSKIVATGRSQVKLSSSETIRIHYCRLSRLNSSRLSSQGRKCCDISLDVWMLGILWKRELNRLRRFFPVYVKNVPTLKHCLLKKL